MKKYFFYATILSSFIFAQSSLQASSNRSLETDSGTQHLGKLSSLYTCSVSDFKNEHKRKEIDSYFKNNPNDILYLEVKENDVSIFYEGIPYLNIYAFCKSIRKLHIIDDNGYAKIIAPNFLNCSNLEELYITASKIETIMPSFCCASWQHPNQLKKFEGDLPKLKCIHQDFLGGNFEMDEFVLFSEDMLSVPFSPKHNVKKVEFLDSSHKMRFSGTVIQGVYQREK